MKNYFEVGQTVWDVIRGKGKVYEVRMDEIYPIKVKFKDNIIQSFTVNGELLVDRPRTLFFSEPVVSGAEIPPFTPKLKQGAEYLIEWKEKNALADRYEVVRIHEELRDLIYIGTGVTFINKSDIKSVRLLGVEITLE